MSPKASDTTEKKPRKAASRTRARKTGDTGDAVTAKAVAPEEEPSTAAAAKRAPARRRKAAEPMTEALAAEAKAPAAKPVRTPRRKPAAAASEATVPEPVAVAEEAPRKPRRAPRRKAAPPAEAVSPVAEVSANETIEETAPAPKARARKTAVKAAPEKTAPAAKKPAPRRRSAKVAAAPVETDTIDEIVENRPLHVSGALDGVIETEATIAAPVAVESAPPQPVAEKTAAPEADKTTFADLGLSEPLLRAVLDMGYIHPTPIQAQAIPAVLQGQDVLGVAQTGTGKTASFTLPMLEILSGSRARARMPRSLILEPTRELALQVAENFVNYGKHLKLTHALLIGGESMADQKEVLNKGVDVLIATPGRLIDLFERGGLLLTQTRILVIDEADRMLDMGFIPDIERIVSLLPPHRQTLFFSATMAPEIRRLADAFLRSPKEITVSKPSTVATTIETGLVVVEEDDKRKMLRKLLRAENLQNAIIFCNRKRDVDVLLKSLLKHSFSAGALHGDLPQSVRFQTLEKFKSGELKLLVCSDVAARGIDIGGLSHVFNFDLPFHAEDYVHRTGRTGRAGKEGKAYSLATPYERKLAEAIETLTGKPIPRLEVEGLRQLDWASDEEARASRGKRRKRNTREREPEQRPKPQQEERPRKAPVPEAVVAVAPPVAEREERRPANGRDRKPDPRRNRGSEIADAPAESVVGFGADMPAFMNLPKRVPVKFDTTTDDVPEA
ncbi:DEAD/DEAH box helicase [Acetobacter conturbans]|uniref:DEAD/DEAH box helicase n=1 Tax=Acetobacter conturbans TaxID=1737472 RepID=A0ABX0JZD0_9PROT|nr:DEAD/DEAH box helicase [Acetobacter conturbans]NHN88754.1 DEAD/DEAH box helicase [Acetobacter conturbans]